MPGRNAASTVEALRLIADGFTVPEAADVTGADRSTLYKAVKRKEAVLAQARKKKGSGGEPKQA